MRSDSHRRFQMFGMHQQADEIITVQIQPEKYADADVVNASLHRPVHRLGVIGVVVFGPGGVQLFVGFFVISFLKQNIGADSGFLKLAVILHGSGGDIDIDPPDGAVFVFDAINRLDALQHIFYRVIHRIFPGFQRQPLMPHILEGDDFPRDLFLRQLFARNVLVSLVIRAVNATVDAVIGEIQRRKHHDPVAVKLLFDFPRQRLHFFILVRKVTFQQHRRFTM